MFDEADRDYKIIIWNNNNNYSIKYQNNTN